ncbi:hypothetical protein Tco_0502645 [Tanacetum coccineum]
MEESNVGAGNFVDKIKNIDGKIIKDGKLRTAMRGIALNQPGTFVVSLDGVVREKEANPKTSIDNAKDTGSSGGSFASLLKNPNSHAATKAVRLKVMNNSECVQGAIVAIPLAAVEEVSARFENTLYGYFIGHRLAFPLVENYVKNAWAKFGLERPMLKKGFFFFQFLTREGMEKVLENGPWLIRLVPIFLNIWTPNTRLTKDTITSAPIWVKMHNVPIVAYSEVGLSLITSQDSIVMAIPFPDGTGHSLETMDIKYEWVPPWCDVCKNFDHVAVDCPKREKVPAAAVEEEDDRFTKVNRKNGKKKQNLTKQVAGIKFSKPKPNIIYRPVFKQSNNEEGVGLNQNKPPDQNKPHEPILTKSQPITKSVPNKSDDSSIFFTRNSFESLMSANLGEGNIDPMHATSSTYCDPGKDDEEEVEEVYNECDNQKGASTLSEVWKWTSNELSCSKGSRIILGRNPNIVNVVIISFNDQVMHACIAFKAEKKELFYFNVSLSADESSVGTSYIDTGMRDFQECVENIEVADVNSTGLRFTWNQKPMGNDGTLKKIDRIMANIEFNFVFVGACAVFQPYRISDHSPAILRLPMNFVKRLKLLKKPFRNLLYDEGNLNENVKKLRYELDEVQKSLDTDSSNVDLREEEAAYIKAFHNALIEEERFLFQKAKIDWLKLGDANTAYFHKLVKSQAVPLAFINHYTEFLGQPGMTSHFDSNDLFCKRLSNEAASFMIREVSDKEIKEALFSLGDNKAPGPNGYSAAFFKEAWDIISVDVCKAIKKFFMNGVLLKELNHTIIALIPKVANPLRINDFRPISCCNKIISNRMKESLSELVSLNQFAFVPGRRISDNILLTQELMHNYHLDRGPSRCAFKVNIQKAYDTVDWGFMKLILIGFGFHPRMIGWIMECVTTTSFSISINGTLHGYFKGKRGLRQGDPMPPTYLRLSWRFLLLC